MAKTVEEILEELVTIHRQYDVRIDAIDNQSKILIRDWAQSIERETREEDALMAEKSGIKRREYIATAIRNLPTKY